MLNLLKSPHVGHQRQRRARHIHLNCEFRSDLLWWTTFAERWNGVAIARPSDSQASRVVMSDASGSWGCAAWLDQAWFQLRWDNDSAHFSISVKELIPVVVAAVVWGRSWQGHVIHCQCDNQAVVAVIKSRLSPEPHMMHMLCCLFFVEVHFHLHPTASYISTKDNDTADDLSRNRVTLFHSKMPQADVAPTHIPPPPLLFNPQMDWVFPGWTEQFANIFQLGLAHSTRRTYRVAMNQFHVMCAMYNIIDPFPVTELTLHHFAAFLANKRMVPQLIQAYLSTLRNTNFNGIPPTHETSPLSLY